MKKILSVLISAICLISMLSFMTFAEEKDYYKYTAPSGFVLETDTENEKVWKNAAGNAIQLSIEEIDDEHYGATVAGKNELKKLEEEMLDAFSSSFKSGFSAYDGIEFDFETVKFEIEDIGDNKALVAVFKATTSYPGLDLNFYGKILELDSYKHTFVFADLISMTSPEFDRDFMKSVESFEILESKASKAQRINPAFIIAVVAGAFSALIGGIKGKKRKSKKAALDANGMPVQAQPVYYNPQADSTLNTNYYPAPSQNPDTPSAAQQDNQTSFNPNADPWEQ